MMANPRDGTAKERSEIRTNSGRLGKTQEKNRKAQTRIEGNSEYSIGLSQYKNNIEKDVKPTVVNIKHK